MTVLHVGCGYAELPEWLSGHSQVRLDVDPRCNPDIVASITDLGNIGPYDVVYSSHCLEHLYPHDVPIALREFRRVLRDGGYAAIFVPDLEGIQPTEDTVLDTPAGKVSGLDMFYGFRHALKIQPFMAHHCGFISETLAKVMHEAGFSTVKTARLQHHNLMGVGIK